LCSISPRVSETRCKLVEWERGCRKKDSMPITIRRAEAADAPRCGTILYRAFENLADYHNFSRDFPSVEAATGVVSMLLANPGFYGIVAEEGSRIVGSNFADHRSSIAGIGPISIDPDAQNQGIGRKLMQAAIDHFTAANVPGIRLVQAAYHNRSLSLYTRLGFQTREPLSVIQGPVLNVKFAGYDVRPGNEADIETCNRLCRRVHGFDRGVELREAIGAGTAIVVEHLGRITGYATKSRGLRVVPR
jgi:ribosomal protein S18 acetylase RimI-like enzyme